MSPYHHRSSALTGKSVRCLSDAFGCSSKDVVHPMPEPSLWRRLVAWFSGMPDTWETK